MRGNGMNPPIDLTEALNDCKSKIISALQVFDLSPDDLNKYHKADFWHFVEPAILQLITQSKIEAMADYIEVQLGWLLPNQDHITVGEIIATLEEQLDELRKEGEAK